MYLMMREFFFASRRRHTRSYGDWSSDVCSSDLARWTPSLAGERGLAPREERGHGRPVVLGGDEASEVPMLEGQQIGRASCRERVRLSECAREVLRKEV